MSGLQRLNLTFRALMEAGVVFGLRFWGYHTGRTGTSKVLLAVGAPVLGFGIWGLLDFRRAGALAEPLRLIEELAISGLAALALYVAGQHALGWSLATISVVHHALVYLLGDRLIKR